MNWIRPSHFASVAVGCCLLLIPTAHARAQTIASTDRLASAAADSTTVYVVDKSGGIIKGRLTGLTADAFVLRVNGQPRSIRLVDVARVDKRDSNRNGALIGGFTTLALWFVPTYAEGERPTGAWVPVAAYVFGVGAGLGALIDLANSGRTALYERAPITPVGRHATGAPRRHALVLAWRF